MARRCTMIFLALAMLTPVVGRGVVAQARPPKGPVLVYETRRPALDVSITRRGDRLWRAAYPRPVAATTG